MTLREDYIYMGDLETPGSNLAFFHSALKIINIMLTYNKNAFLILFENDFISVLLILVKKIAKLMMYMTSEVKINIKKT